MIFKLLYIFLGWIFFLLGVIGIFLPLLPTTPFLLLAGFCFSKGSKKFHAWLINHKYFGPPINDWKSQGVIRIQHKCLATLMLTISAVFIFPKQQIPLIGKISFAVIACGVLLFIWSRPSLPSDKLK